MWFDNGGRNYGAASIEVYKLHKLQRGNAEGSWHFYVSGTQISFHPTPKKACRQAVADLHRKGDQIAERIAAKKKGTS